MRVRRWIRVAAVACGLSIAATASAQEAGPRDPAVVAALDEATRALAEGRLFRAAKHNEAAFASYQRSADILRRVLGDNHPDAATVLNELGVFYQETGDDARAELLLKRALAMREKSLGPTARAVAESLDNLAGVYQERSELMRAEPLYERALAIWRAAGGDAEVETARVLSNLAVLLDGKGDLARAIDMAEQALSLREKALGPTHQDVAASLINLGGLYRKQGDPRRAVALCQRALTIAVNGRATSPRVMAAALESLAHGYMAAGEPERAAPLYERAITYREDRMGERHPDIASTLVSLADLVRAGGDHPRAESLYRRAIALQDGAGVESARTAACLRRLALALAQDGSPSFIPLLERATSIMDRLATPILAAGSEEQKRLYVRDLQRNTEQVVGLHLRFAKANVAAARLSLTTILRRKGRVLDAMTDTFASVRRHLTPEAQALLDQLSSTDARLAASISRGPGALSPEEHRQQLAALEATRQTLERKLAALSAGLVADQQLVELAQVQAALSEGTTLLELVRHQLIASRPGDPQGPPRYAAYLLRRRGDPIAIDLGEAAPIETAVKDLRKALGDPDLTRDPRPSARALDALVLQPLRAHLAGARQIFLSPDGDLSLVPFEALVDEQGRYAVERFAFTYLVTGRDLLRFQRTPRPADRPLLLGDPAFDVVADGPRKDTEQAGSTRGLRSIDMIKGPFERLRSTGEEVKAIARVLPDATVLLGPDATEGALKGARAPRILHLSTHGFFLPEQPGGAREAENPLLRSGLLLAGADQRESLDDDGILTALEAANLDLHGTRLVVIATCESGLGQAVSGEGVYGLRRALTMAGAETQVMSLWEVSSGATRALMTSYYQRLAAGEGRGEALRNVELGMLDDPGTAHPHLWAAFIVSGSGATLDGEPVDVSRFRVAQGARGCGCATAGDGRPGPPGLLLAAALALGRLSRRRGRIVAKRRALWINGRSNSRPGLGASPSRREGAHLRRQGSS